MNMLLKDHFFPILYSLKVVTSSVRHMIKKDFLCESIAFCLVHHIGKIFIFITFNIFKSRLFVLTLKSFLRAFVIKTCWKRFPYLDTELFLSNIIECVSISRCQITGMWTARRALVVSSNENYWINILLNIIEIFK